MDAGKDYSTMRPEELVVEEKRAHREQITTAVLIGFLIGVIIYGLATKGFGLLHTLLPAGLIVLIARNTVRTKERLAAIRAELGKKRPA
ncbi:MAG: hypothetical protein IT227_16505 [Flavobacteriales bacterium]|nr:hypothetical protein [Flavobacteriales bacterium]